MRVKLILNYISLLYLKNPRSSSFSSIFGFSIQILYFVEFNGLKGIVDFESILSDDIDSPLSAS
jgi:hypothetical protein